MEVPEELKLAIEALEELLGKRRIQLKHLREKLRPWVENKGLKLHTPRNFFYITWSRGLTGKQDQQPNTWTTMELSIEQIKGVLDHVGIMAVNMATAPETTKKDSQVLTAIGNLASAITDELNQLSTHSSGLSKEALLGLLQEPLHGIGLRLSKKK